MCVRVAVNLTLLLTLVKRSSKMTRVVLDTFYERKDNEKAKRLTFWMLQHWTQQNEALTVWLKTAKKKPTPKISQFTLLFRINKKFQRTYLMRIIYISNQIFFFFVLYYPDMAFKVCRMFPKFNYSPLRNILSSSLFKNHENSVHSYTPKKATYFCSYL